MRIPGLAAVQNSHSLRAPDHRLTPSELAQKAGVTRATITGLLDGLEKREWIERREHPGDRRSVIIELSSSGKAFLDEILPAHLKYITRLISGIDESELVRFMETLERIEANIGVESDA